MIKEKKSLKSSKTSSRRKFFKAAAATGAAAATAVAMPNIATAGAHINIKDASSLAFRRKHLF